MNRNAPTFAALLVALACSGESTGPGGNNSTGMQHLTQIVDIMQANSLHRLTIDWTKFRDSVFRTSKNSETIPDTYLAIFVALQLLGDGHSQYRPVSGAVIMAPTRSCFVSGGTRPALPANIGYVRVGSTSSAGTAASEFATRVQDSIRVYDRADLIGWLVDLRSNGGGNMWPMIAGLGPILGDGVLGYFVHPTGARETWRYENGFARLNDVPIVAAVQPYRLLKENPRVAVLVDNAVASSGEATYIAFRGRANTRSFGVATCGASTANLGFQLGNGATLLVTTSLMADRNMVNYGGQVTPDYVGTSNADVEANAIAWLQQAANVRVP